MTISYTPGWTASIREVVIGATAAEGGTRRISYRIGGESDLPCIGLGQKPLIAFEICDDPALWPDVVRSACTKLIDNPPAWAAYVDTTLQADLIRLNLTSTRRRNFDAYDSVGKTVTAILAATSLPLIIEGSADAEIDSEVFQRCGEVGEKERLVLGTAEAARYRSVAAAAIAYGHSVIAQSPIDVNLAKQLNILLREAGVPDDRIIIDPYTGALGYGFEYTYSTMERIRFAALKGDADLAMPMICAPTDTLTIKEIRGAVHNHETAVSWEVATSIAAALAGATILVVRHPGSLARLRKAIDSLWNLEVA
ncbi:MAG TPA: acetyl-CoA decarbonylase/synthase complex subunit delta [Methanospirillum sp.]|uniref:acetyl-CoA decarbonylase/synthase complex subunit delta n=1 Tax=Methanospirillum sp. TaxID=45200 RepID=UPI002B63A77E|nr:acetyl-CoA decarbonylase/synthase complex subunit delta [Methanospirillum sp.]HWQ63273.1 acetyl-CoA decarbonylase/synthase complex subunit delta [Methanospirillum sp.]